MRRGIFYRLFGLNRTISQLLNDLRGRQTKKHVRASAKPNLCLAEFRIFRYTGKCLSI
jgi:hypothetical protein